MQEIPGTRKEVLLAGWSVSLSAGAVLLWAAHKLYPVIASGTFYLREDTPITLESDPVGVQFLVSMYVFMMVLSAVGGGRMLYLCRRTLQTRHATSDLRVNPD